MIFFSRYCYRQNSPTWLTQSHWAKKSIEILIFSLKCINLDYFQLNHAHQILQKDNSIQKFYMGVGMYRHAWHHPKWEPQFTSFLGCICVCKKNEKYPSFNSGGYCKSKYLVVWLTERISGQNLSYETSGLHTYDHFKHKNNDKTLNKNPTTSFLGYISHKIYLPKNHAKNQKKLMRKIRCWKARKNFTGPCALSSHEVIMILTSLLILFLF